MKILDRETIESIGIPSAVLMERAALSTVEEILRSSYSLSHVIVVAGCGNNGGDGVCVARLLKERHYEPEVFVLGEPKSGSECAGQLLIADRIGVKITTGSATECQKFLQEHPATLLIDAVFGVGFHGDLPDDISMLIEAINAGNVPVVAVDIPTGVNASSGKVTKNATKCDLTVTYGAYKIGQFLYPGCTYCGKVAMHEIGIHPGKTVDESDLYALERDDLKAIQRPDYSNKGTFGKVLLIAGSKDVGGAAILSAKAAFTSGAGMVKAVTHENNREALLSAAPEVMLKTYTDTAPDLSEELKWADVIAIGPGISYSDIARSMLEAVIRGCSLPLVLDADALMLLKDHAELQKELQDPVRTVIITPHLGEFSKLTGSDMRKITDDLPGTCRSYAKDHELICVLKDARTVISNGERTYLNLSGNSGMATAGSGDVLLGLIASLLGQGLGGLDAAATGCFIHGLAGDEAAGKYGKSGMVASNIIEAFHCFMV